MLMPNFILNFGYSLLPWNQTNLDDQISIDESLCSKLNKYS